jgi:threonine 3-dehydrogenase
MGDAVTMLALRKAAPRPGIDFQRISPSLPTDRTQVTVAVEAAGICGTDLHIADWTSGYESMTNCMPVTLGHEFSGRLQDGPDGMRGRRIVARPSVTCDHCEDCHTNRENTCKNRRGIGIHRDGAFSSQVCLPLRNCIIIPETLDPELAALTEPMTVAVQAIARAGEIAGKHVLVVGPGPIGLGAALFARQARASRIVIVGKQDGPRLSCARSLGFDELIDLAESESLLEKSVAERGLFDTIIEATGVPDVASQCQSLLQPGGVLVICGIHPRPAQIDLTRLVRLEQRLVGSYRAPVSTWPNVIEALSKDGETFRKLITHRLPLASAIQGFDLMRRREAVKVVLFP